MMSHALVNITEPTQSDIARFLFLSGGSGVDLFFQISGFILVLSTEKCDGTFSYVLSFIGRRFLRVWPAYFAATILFMGAGYGANIFLDPSAQTRIVKSLLFIPLNYYDSPPFFGYAALAVGWTLNYEMYFYTISAVAMLFGRFRWAALLTWFALTVVIAPALLDDFSFAAIARYPVTGYLNLMTNPILLNFIAGILAGLLYIRCNFNMPAGILKAAVLTSVLITIILLVFRIRSGHGLAYYGIGYFLILLSLAISMKSGAISRYPAIMVWLGTISYSLYLVHPTIQYLVPTFLIRNGLESWTKGLSMAASTTLISIIFAFCFAKIFETWVPSIISTMVADRTRLAPRG